MTKTNVLYLSISSLTFWTNLITYFCPGGFKTTSFIARICSNSIELFLHLHPRRWNILLIIRVLNPFYLLIKSKALLWIKLQFVSQQLQAVPESVSLISPDSTWPHSSGKWLFRAVNKPHVSKVSPFRIFSLSPDTNSNHKRETKLQLN